MLFTTLAGSFVVGAICGTTVSLLLGRKKKHRLNWLDQFVKIPIFSGVGGIIGSLMVSYL